jgi:hypothetical protein
MKIDHGLAHGGKKFESLGRPNQALQQFLYLIMPAPLSAKISTCLPSCYGWEAPGCDNY